MFFDNSTIGDDAWRQREAARRRKQWTVQAVFVVVVAALVWMMAGNVSDNLSERNIRSGFAFLANPANFDIGESMFEFFSSDAAWKAFAVGLANTVRVSVLAIITATVMGVVVGLMRLSNHPIIKFLGVAHVEFYRNIPLIIQLFAIYMVMTELLPMSTEAITFGSWGLLSKAGLQFAVPVEFWTSLAASAAFALVVFFIVRHFVLKYVTGLVANVSGMAAAVVTALVVWIAAGFIGGWSKPVVEGFSIEGGASLSPEFLSLWLGLTMFTSAAIAEIVRAGILAVSSGQWNSGLALGMTRIEVISYVVFPQSMRLAIPPMASQYMNLTKNSSLAVVIGYPDIVAVGNTTINITGQALEAIVIIMAVYLVLNLIISVLMNALNARVMRAPK